MNWSKLALAGALIAPITATAQERTTLGGRDVVIWKPKTAGRAPLVVFSHGFGGCALQSKFLTEGLAAHGYFVVAPNHKDARCGRGGGAERPEEPFQNPAKWSDSTFADRRDDVRSVIRALRENAAYRDQIDFERLALAGHSLGGYTVVGLAGGWPSWKLDGVRAVLALSPYVEPYVVHHSLALAAPVMYQGGTLDVGITPSLRRANGAYDQSASPKYFVDLSRAGHFAWTDLRADFHASILDYALPFLDRYVRGAGSGDRLTTKTAGIAELRFDTTRKR